MIDRGPAIQLVGLTKFFGDVVAVDGIDLQIDDGEFFSLLGPSGSGKTTMLRMIAGFEQPTAGAILLDGATSPTVPPFDRDVNTVFQDYALFPHMTVAENVEYGLKVKRVPKAERRRAGHGGAGRVRLDGFGDAQAEPALRRPAPARRARPGAGQPAAGPAARRAARCARPQAPRGDAGRAEADPARRRHHLRVRHPRPGRGAHDEQPHRRVQPRAHRAGRHADGGLRATGDVVRRRLRRYHRTCSTASAADCSGAARSRCGPRRSGSSGDDRDGVVVDGGTVSDVQYLGAESRATGAVARRRPELVARRAERRARRRQPSAGRSGLAWSRPARPFPVRSNQPIHTEGGDE